MSFLNLDFDVLIAGAGLAGIYTALNLKESLRVLIISKKAIEECNSFLAQGGIAVARDEDDYEAFIKDTLVAGGNENNLAALNIMARESQANISRLLELGVEFDRDETGNFEYTREGAHCKNRIIHCKDHTGEAVLKVLIKELRTRKNITVMENTVLLDLITTDNTCLGGIILKDDSPLTIHAKFTILATGGIGGLFRNSTNFSSTTGDGLTIALNNGLKITHLDYIQIHPTAFYDKKDPSGKSRRLLISESLRGEGAVLKNCRGERFTDELLPRDVLTNAILAEEEKTGCPHVYLDISFQEADHLKKRFPVIYEECLKRGVDITKEPIPVTPAQHYLMGGIEVDTFSRTSMNNLFACGEVSCTGLHGRNRLASNSLMESLVFSRRAAETINDTAETAELIIDNEADDLALAKSRGNKKLILKELEKISEGIKNELVTD